jgi:hypothetical protein
MKTLFSAESTKQAIAEAKVAPKVKKAALTTPLGSSVLRKGRVTQTAQLDFVLVAGIALSETHEVHLNQLVELGRMAEIEFSAGRMKHHIRTNKVATVSAEGVVSVEEKMLDFYCRAVEALSFKVLVTLFAEGLAKVIGIEQAEWDDLSEKEKAERIESAHEEAVGMNAPKAKAKRRKAKK